MKKVIIISGPTASGKSQIADYIYSNVESADFLVNADSIQVYKDLPTLTALPEPREYNKLYGFKKREDKCSIALWLKDLEPLLEKPDSVTVIVGGTGMYIKGLIYGLASIPEIPESVRKFNSDLFQELGGESFYNRLIKIDPNVAGHIKENDKQRLIRAAEVFQHTGKSIFELRKNKARKFNNLDIKHVSLMPDRESLYARCNKRFDLMLKSGALEEVKKYNESKSSSGDDFPVERALGYNEISRYLRGECSLDDCKKYAKQLTRNYAKRQMTWFRHQGEAVHHEYGSLNSAEEKSILSHVRKFLSL